MDEDSEMQAVEGYLCSCGFKTPDKSLFTKHVLGGQNKKGEEHRSRGRVNMETGEITMPPYNERTDEQKKASQHARKTGKSITGGKAESRMTDNPSIAQEIRFVPRIYTADYSPIMRAAQTAAVREWNWRTDMPLGNFLDTIIYNFFKEHGITLAGYIVETENPGDCGNGHHEAEPEEILV